MNFYPRHKLQSHRTATVSMIARRRLIDRLRRDRRRSEVEPRAAAEHDTHHPGDSGERGWDAERAARAIEQLSPDQQRVLRMGMLQGMTQSEIARATDTPLGTVKTRIRDGMIRLRETFAPTRRET